MVARTFDILLHNLRDYPRKDIFAAKRNGKWQRYSTCDYVERSRWAAAAMLELGMKKGDTAATICSNNLPEWNFLDMGMSMTGVIHVPVYPTISSESFEFILRQSGAKYLFISDSDILQRLKPVLPKLTQVKEIYSFERIEDIPSWDDFFRKGHAYFREYRAVLASRRSSITENDPATLIYTSGTTGNHKGVLLTHRNLVSNLKTAASIQPLGYKDKVLSFLPLSHIYERTSNYQFQYSGSCIYYAEDISSIMENLRELRPHGFTAVPRVLEKIRSAYIIKGNKKKGLKRTLFEASLNLTDSYPANHKTNTWFRIRSFFLYLVVFRKIKKVLGGRIKFIGCGGARLAPQVERLFWTAKTPVYQGYGLSETSPLVSLNRVDSKHIGSVGPVIPGVEVKISEDEEILVKGPNVMKGYFLEEEYTKEVIDNDGWFHTGDLGSLKDGFLFIAGRKKELFKTSYGKYIAPQTIESKFRESELISQIMVIGEGEKFTGALVIPNFDLLFKWVSSMFKISIPDRNKLLQLPQVKNFMESEINDINSELDSWQQVKNYKLVDRDWSVPGGELSPSFKLRRNFILNKYRELVNAIYKG